MKKRALAILVLVCVCCALVLAACGLFGNKVSCTLARTPEYVLQVTIANMDDISTIATLGKATNRWSTSRQIDKDKEYVISVFLDEDCAVDSLKMSINGTEIPLTKLETCYVCIYKPTADFTITLSESQQSAPVVEVSSVTLNKTECTLAIGDEETLTATVNPDNAANKTVMWKSSDTSVATVDNDGKVVAVAQGTAVISASVGKISADCTVNVSAAATDALAGKTFVCYDVKCRSDVYGEEEVKTTEDLTKEHNIGSTLVFNNDGTFLWTIESSKQSGTYELDGETITLTYTSPAGYKATALYIDGEITMEVNVMKIITCYYLRLQTA